MILQYLIKSASNMLLKSQFLNLLQTNFKFSKMSTNFLKSNPNFNGGSQLISLSNEQMFQLRQLSHYTTSIEYLQKNDLDKSLSYLQYTLNDAKNIFPYSINLHSCLMNRMSILYKLLNRTSDFQQILQELYFISLSSKGVKSLETIKNLINYMICLLVYNRKKASAVIDFIGETQKTIPEYLLFFDGVVDILVRKQFENGIKKLQKLPEDEAIEKVFKWNNLTFMKIVTLQQAQKNPADYLIKLKQSGHSFLVQYLYALLEGENLVQNAANTDEQAIKENEQFQDMIKQYLSGKRSALPIQNFATNKFLFNNNSHIITMNIATLLFELERTQESLYFLQLSLEKAISLNELERVGQTLIFIGKCYFINGIDLWERLYLDILQNRKNYPQHILREALVSYSRILFQNGRTVEAQNYFNQALALTPVSGFEGLILPSYDFSY